MLAPALATMLCVITTDADIAPETAQRALAQATSTTFDRIDSDGCMSTNDTVILLASGASGITPTEAEFTTAITAVAKDLSRALINDAEGASHDIAVTVTHATSEDAALAVARSITRSNLVKTAIFGNDPNWGRVLASLGTVPTHVAPYEPDAIDVTINGVTVCRNGESGTTEPWSTLPPTAMCTSLSTSTQEIIRPSPCGPTISPTITSTRTAPTQHDHTHPPHYPPQGPPTVSESRGPP